MPTTERGTHIALIFALVAERLVIHYEHDVWMTQAQGATLAADWLSRSKRSLPLKLRKHLSELSDQVAKQIATTTTRETGLIISHELQEALDTRYESEIGQAIMVECERILDEQPPEPSV